MKSIAGIGFFMLFLIQGIAQIDSARDLFFRATDASGIEVFYKAALNFDESSPVLRAYKGVAVSMYAGNASSVGDKLEYFNKGKAMLEAAVASDWYNPEIRFLRFSVQSEVPFFLGYSDKLVEDAYVVIDALENGKVDFSENFWRKAISLMKNSGELNRDQDNRIKKFIS